MAIYVDSTGFNIVLNVLQDISNSTVRRIYYKKPSAETGYWEASLRGLTEITHSILQEDLDEVGRWELQAYVETSGWSCYGEIVYMDVEQNIEAS
jgi:hypothetical protein